MLLYALFKYEKLGEVATIFSANKLAYFLQKNKSRALQIIIVQENHYNNFENLHKYHDDSIDNL